MGEKWAKAVLRWLQGSTNPLAIYIYSSSQNGIHVRTFFVFVFCTSSPRTFGQAGLSLRPSFAIRMLENLASTIL